MKKIILLLAVLLSSSLVSAQATDFELQQLIIDVNWPVDECSVSLVIEGESYPIEAHQIDGSIITLYLKENQDYNVIINCQDHITLSLNSWDVVDEQDLDITADVSYQFEEGILVFDY